MIIIVRLLHVNRFINIITSKNRTNSTEKNSTFFDPSFAILLPHAFSPFSFSFSFSLSLSLYLSRSTISKSSLILLIPHLVLHLHPFSLKFIIFFCLLFPFPLFLVSLLSLPSIPCLPSSLPSPSFTYPPFLLGPFRLPSHFPSPISLLSFALSYSYTEYDSRGNLPISQDHLEEAANRIHT